MAGKIVFPWVEAEERVYFQLPTLKRFGDEGFEVEWVYDVSSAVEKLTKERAPFILGGLMVPFGYGDSQRECAQRGLFIEGSGIYVVEKVREEGSVNADTLFIVADYYLPTGALMCPDVEKRVLEAGADAYFNWNQVSGKDFVSEVRNLIESKVAEGVIRAVEEGRFGDGELDDEEVIVGLGCSESWYEEGYE